ncbi:penicillin-binding protein 2 [Thermodesulfovibrionales bacterium]|nr:penicillin-binding protein 2 [Thermodesulfovibrionales bacterium]
MTTTKIKIVSFIIIGIFLILCLRLWQLQILEGDEHKEISKNNKVQILKTPPLRGVIYDRNGIPLVKNVPTFNASIILDSSGKKLDIDALAEFLGLEKHHIQEKLNARINSPFVPIRLKRDISLEDVARIKVRRSDFPGLFVEIKADRKYTFGMIGAHITGHLGKITTEQLRSPELRNSLPFSMVGQWGIEALFDNHLTGIPGENVMKVDALGRKLGIIRQKQPIQGGDVKLSIDISVQKTATDAFGDKAGALVAMDPNSGEILALVSLPSFDPNIFSEILSYDIWKSLKHDPRHPLLNRAVQSQYPPGSAFKIITALAALEEEVVCPDERIKCTGSISIGDYIFRCWRAHGYINLHDAFVQSSNIFFYEMGKRLGIDKIYKYATSLGLGRETGIKLTPMVERSGLIPNVKWKREKKNLPWFLGDTLVASIGQGSVSVTPIQMAVMLSAIVNGGYIHRPSLVKGDSELLREIQLSPETIRILKEAMSGVVNDPDGTAHGIRSSLTTIGGKTGTAQVVALARDETGKAKGPMSHAWFVGFAPVDNPEIVVSVIVEHGGRGGAVAAPIAKRVIEEYLKRQETLRGKAPVFDNVSASLN